MRVGIVLSGLAFALAMGPALSVEAKPSPRKSRAVKKSSSDRTARNWQQRRVTRSSRKTDVAVFATSQFVDVANAPTALGVAAEALVPWGKKYRFAVGGTVGYQPNRILLQPHVGAIAPLGMMGPIGAYGALGVATPVQLLSETVAVGVAGRAVLGLRWNWSVSNKVRPELEAVGTFGTMVTPEAVRFDFYGAFAMQAGVRF